MIAGHYREVCRHGEIVRQCRCPGPHVPRYVEECPAACKPDELALLGDVQAAAIIMLATVGNTYRPLPPQVERLRRAVEASAPGAVEATEKALASVG